MASYPLTLRLCIMIMPIMAMQQAIAQPKNNVEVPRQHGRPIHRQIVHPASGGFAHNTDRQLPAQVQQQLFHMISTLNLSPDQISKIRQLLIEKHHALNYWDKQTAPAIRNHGDAMLKANREDDQIALNMASRELNNLRMARTLLADRYDVAIDRVLGEQKARQLVKAELLNHLAQRFPMIRRSQQLYRFASDLAQTTAGQIIAMRNLGVDLPGDQPPTLEQEAATAKAYEQKLPDYRDNLIAVMDMYFRRHLQQAIAQTTQPAG